MSLLELRHLSHRFGGIAVIDDVSLVLEKGDRVALIGPNGAGKTTLVNLVSGQLKPASGSVVLGGQVMDKASLGQRARAGLVRSFQVTRLFADLSVQEHVALAILQRLGRAGRVLADHRVMPEVVAESATILGLLALDSLAKSEAGQIAYGQQRLLEIAIVMALKPKVLLLDEPAAGVTRADTALIERALAQLPTDLAVLMIEHDMDLVFRFAQRVVVLAAGAIIFDGTAVAAAQDGRVRAAYLGSYGDGRSFA